MSSATAVTCTVQPDGNTADYIQYVCSAFPSVSLNTSRGSVASATVNLIIDGNVTIQGVGD